MMALSVANKSRTLGGVLSVTSDEAGEKQEGDEQSVSVRIPSVNKKRMMHKEVPQKARNAERSFIQDRRSQP